MNIKYLKLKTWFLTLFVGLFGVSCNGNGIWGGGNGMVEYGCPTVDFFVKGKVTDQNGTTLNNVGINPHQITENADSILKYAEKTGDLYKMYADTTSADGHFFCKYNCANTNIIGVKLLVRDLNKNKQDKHKTMVIDVTFDKKDKIKAGSGVWYKGRYQKEITIKMDK